MRIDRRGDGVFTNLTNQEELTQLWKEFDKTPDERTAKALADVLISDKDRSNAIEAVQRIAIGMAGRLAPERGTLSKLLAAGLDSSYELGLAFLQATATASAVGPKKPQVPTSAPKQDDPMARLGLDPSKLPGPPPDETPEELQERDDRLKRLGALDLASTGQVTVDLIALERRCDDIDDVSSMAYLHDALQVVTAALTGTAQHSIERRKQLAQFKNTTQEHLVEQIGFRAAKSQRDDVPGLSPSNGLAVKYWRTDFADRVRNFLARTKGTKLGLNDFLVNSPQVKRKLGMVVSPEVLQDLVVKPLSGQAGISVLSGTEKHKEVRWPKILWELGATPSAYQLFELMDKDKSPAPSDFKVDTWGDLMGIITSRRFAALQRIARGTGELAPVCAMLEHLVLGLAGQSGPKLFDPLTANALASLYKLLDIVVASEWTPSVAMRAADLMIDEIGIVLVVNRYYRWHDYRAIMRKILLERAPGITAPVEDGTIEVSSHHMTSGMDALGTALFIALSTRGHLGEPTGLTRTTETIDYYEVGDVLDNLKQGKVVTPRKDILIAALNPSAPFDAPAPAKLVKDVAELLQAREVDAAPVALILDTTIQVAPAKGGKSQLDIVLDGLKDAIAEGRLEVLLCKSFQKYASFGTGKVAAGDVTLLTKAGNLASASARFEALQQDFSLDLDQHDEAQLVVHMLTHGHSDELALIGSAARNAEFVDGFCWPITRSARTQGSSYIDGLPLLLRSATPGDVDELFDRLTVIDRRDSFSFLRTSYVGGIGAINQIVGPFVRINTGHESKATLVEYLYAFGHLATGTPPGAPLHSGTKMDLTALSVKMVREHLDALAEVPRTDTTGIERYRSHIRTSYYLFAAQVMPGSDVLPLLLEYFATGAGRGTVESQRVLARKLFRTADNLTTADPALLTTLSSAAAVMPAGEVRRIAPKLLTLVKEIGTAAERLSKTIG